MGVSFKISKKGTRFRPKPKSETPAVVEADDVDAPPQIPKKSATNKLSVDIAEDNEGFAAISDANISFCLSLFPDGYSIVNPSENDVGHQSAVQDDPKFLHPYDRTSESFFSAIESGRLPGDFLDDIPCKYINGAVFCEVRDYRNCSSEPGANGPSVDVSPVITKVCLKMSLENVVKDIPLISKGNWTYGDLMEVESRILKALQPKLNLDPTPQLDRLCKNPTKLNLDIPGLRRKRLRQMSGVATAPDNQIQGKKVCMNRGLADSGTIVQQPDIVNLTTQNVGPSNMLTSRPKPFAPDTSVPPSPSMSHQPKYQSGVGNPRLMQDPGAGPVFSAPGTTPGMEMMNSYTDGMNSTMTSVHGKRESQDGPLSPVTSLNKRARSNPMSLDGSQQQQVAPHMDGFNATDSHWKNSLIQQQSIGRSVQYSNVGIQKYPQQMFDGSFNQEAGAMPFTMGQQGLRYNLKQEPVEMERLDKPELNRAKNEMHMVDPELNHVDSQQARLHQRLPQNFSRFPQAPWNNMVQPLESNSRKEEQLQRRKPAQSPRVSAGGLPQSPLSSKSGEFSSGSMGTQFGPVATTAALGSAQREKSAVTSVPAVGGTGSLTSSANDSMQRQHQAQMAVNRRSNSLPKTPAMSGVGSPASVGNMSAPFNANSPPVGKEIDKHTRDRFSKIDMLTVRFQLNSKKNKVDEYKKTTTFPTQQLAHCLFNDHNNDNLKDETCKMPLSKSLVGGSMNVCKTRVLNFVQTERVPQGNGFSLVPKSRTRMILSEKANDGTVAMHYGELDDCDYLAAEECLPTLPNTHTADLLAAQFCSLIIREGYHVEGDHLQLKPINTACSSGSQPNSAPAVPPSEQNLEAVSGQLSNDVKQSIGGTNNASGNSSHTMRNARMHPPGNSQLQGGLLPGVAMPPSRPQQAEPQTSLQQQQNQHLMQQQLQRSTAMMLASNPLSHLNAMGQNPSMQQLGTHMLNKASTLQLQLIQQQQQQQQQQPQLQRKMMMGLGNVGMGGGVGSNNMVGLQGLGNVMGMGGARAGTGIAPPMTGAISGMAGNMGQNPMNISQGSNVSNVISQQLRSGMLPTQTALMAPKLRVVTPNRPNIMGAPGGQTSNIGGLQGTNRQMHPGSSGLSMLGPGINRANTMNPMQRTAMAPPKLMSGMNLYVNHHQQQQQQQLHLQQRMQQQQQLQQQQQFQQQQQQQQLQQQQETTSPLQTVLSPPQQVGSPSMGMPQQQPSPQQMSQRTPMSPQLSSGAIHPPISTGNQEGNCPASPQLSSQTLGSVSSMANSPMELQGVNKSS